MGIFYDFTKAFDTICHDILLNKLTFYGLRGSAHDWLSSYLSGRTQAVKINNSTGMALSEWVNVETGVPQGSVLGPILFLLFINDLPLFTTDSYVTLFADDTSAVIGDVEYKNLRDKANKCVRDIAGWCDRNGLCLNTSKTNLIVFTPLRVVQDRSLLIRDKSRSIAQIECVSFLGIMVDQHLSWSSQIDNVCSKLSSKNYVIVQLRDLVDVHTLKTFYYASVQSILSYGIIAWGNSSSIQRILLLQKRVIRSMF